jgi:hypothetical protein
MFAGTFNLKAEAYNALTKMWHSTHDIFAGMHICLLVTYQLQNSTVHRQTNINKVHYFVTSIDS